MRRRPGMVLLRIVGSRGNSIERREVAGQILRSRRSCRGNVRALPSWSSSQWCLAEDSHAVNTVDLDRSTSVQVGRIGVNAEVKGGHARLTCLILTLCTWSPPRSCSPEWGESVLSSCLRHLMVSMLCEAKRTCFQILFESGQSATSILSSPTNQLFSIRAKVSKLFSRAECFRQHISHGRR